MPLAAPRGASGAEEAEEEEEEGDGVGGSDNDLIGSPVLTVRSLTPPPSGGSVVSEEGEGDNDDES